MKNYLRAFTACTVLIFGLSVAASAHQTATSTDTSATKSKRKHKAKSTDAPAAAPASAADATPVAKAKRAPMATANASDADIAAAKASGKVWVNTESKVYHKSGQFYGKTKHGQFMTEDEAQKAGYHQAKSEIGTKKN